MKHNIKGVIIDFNGTLYLDHDLNQKTWIEAFNSVKPKYSKADYDDINKQGLANDYLLSKTIYHLFNIEATKEQIDTLSENKEKAYRQLARDLNRNELISGTEIFLNYLKENNIPYCIASMAPKGNFDFYLDYLHLDKWFSYDNIIYDNGNYNTKNSQIVDAAKILNIDPKDCLLVEDSSYNIKEAITGLQMNKFIYINTKEIEYNSQEIIQEIKDYTELDYRIFNN